MMSADKNTYIGLWLLLGCFMICWMVVIGGITRLTGSGLSMTDWNLILGAIPPMSQAAWEAVFLRYKQFPQFQEINFDMSLAEFKSIFWWEYIHRMWGRLIGIVYVIPLVYFVAKGMLSKKLLKRVLLAGALGAIQAALGWWMVKSGLADKPWVSPYRLTAHLLLALLAYGYTFWLALDLLMPYRPVKIPAYMRKHVNWISLGLLIQITLGGFMAGTKAALFYPEWPLMGGSFVPDSMFSRSPWIINFFENPANLQFMHRSLAYILLAGIAWLWIRNRKESVGGVESLAIQAIGVFVLMQVVFGIMTLLNSQGTIPLGWGVMHQAGALALLTCALYLSHRFIQDTSVKHSQN